MAKGLKHRLDVVVMDLVMPVLGGIEATAKVVAECPEAVAIAMKKNLLNFRSS